MLTMATPSTWGLQLTSIKPWGDFDDEVISDPNFQNSNILEKTIAKIIFDPLRKDFIQHL